MIKLLKHVMKILYENENYSKYGSSGRNFFMALIGMTFYVFVTLGLVLFIVLAISPGLYRWILGIHLGISSKIAAIIFIGLIALLLRISVKEEDLSNSGLTKEYVKKAVNY